MTDYDASAPLLTRLRRESDRSSISQSWNEAQAGFLSSLRDLRARGRHLLTSPSQHYTLMVFVALDVTLLLLNVFLRLIGCEMHQNDEQWVQKISRGFEITGVVFSYLFMLELAACVFSFGPMYFSSWFRNFDAAVIILGFIISVLTRGTIRSIGSLLVVLRLWRLAKLYEEIVLGAAERIDSLEQRNQELSDEVKGLREQLDLTHTTEV